MTYELLKQDHAVQVYIRQADAALKPWVLRNIALPM